MNYGCLTEAEWATMTAVDWADMVEGCVPDVVPVIKVRGRPLRIFEVGSRVRVWSKGSAYFQRHGTVLERRGDFHYVRLDGNRADQGTRFQSFDLTDSLIPPKIDYEVAVVNLVNMEW